MIKRARSEELGRLLVWNFLTEFQKHLSAVQYFQIYFDNLTMRAGSVAYKHYLLDKRTQNATQNLQLAFAIAPNRIGRRVCECSTHANQEMSSSKADVLHPCEVAHTAQNSDQAAARCDPYHRRKRKCWCL